MTTESSFGTGPEFCGQREMAGNGMQQDYLVNYSARETTPDQSEIEEALAGLDLAGRRILHVGIGNSSLARRLSSRTGWLEGITVSEQERALAQSLAIPNYRVHVLSKYGLDLATKALPPFDIIVDNNLASYACCRYHLNLMFDTYVSLLRPRGLIYTHKLGMDWVVENPCWRLRDGDLRDLSALFGLNSMTVDSGIRILARASA